MNRIIRRIMLPLLLAALAAGCARGLPANTVHSASDLSGKSVGVMEGTAGESYLEDLVGDVYIKIYTDRDALAAELRAGGLDAAVADEDTARALVRSGGLRTLDTPLTQGEYRIAVSEENHALSEKLNSALAELKRDGTLASLASSWEDGDGDRSSSGPRIYAVALTVAIDPDFAPFSFYDENGELTGFEVELARALCDRMGVSAVFRDTDSSMLSYMAESGKVSFAIGRLTEDGSKVTWSEPYIEDAQVIVVRR